MVSDLFGKHDDLSIYNNLLKEIEASGIDSEKLWKLWHGDTHLIADDNLEWKDHCPTFKMVIEKVQKYCGEKCRMESYRNRCIESYNKEHGTNHTSWVLVNKLKFAEEYMKINKKEN